MTILCPVFAVALVASATLTPLARAVARRWKVFDYSDGVRKLHPSPTPLLGGAAVFAAFALAMALASRFAPTAFQHANLSQLLLLAGGLVCAIGCCDDLWGLRVRWKLLGQLLAASLVVWHEGLYDHFVLFGLDVELGWWAAPLAVLWVVGCMNAMNFLDGADGLATTIGLAVSVNIAAVAMYMGREPLAVFALALAGALTGFRWFNRTPATIYLGDAGSLTIGALLAIMVAPAATPTGQPIPIAGMIGLLFIPLFDLTLAVMRRVLEGNHIWIADRAHLHHRLIDRGLPVETAVRLLGLVTLAAGAMTMAAHAWGGEAMAWAAIAGASVFAVRGGIGGRHELRLAREAISQWRDSRRARHAEPVAPHVGILDVTREISGREWTVHSAETPLGPHTPEFEPASTPKTVDRTLRRKAA